MCLHDIDIAILAGGLGTRLRSVLDDRTPKILAQVNGHPFLDHLLDWLAAYGARRIILCLGYLADRVSEHLETIEAPCEIVISIEPSPQGTAGALRHARRHLRTDPVLVLNGDSFVGADLCAFLAAYGNTSAQTGLICTKVSDTSRYGKVHIAPNNTVVSFAEKTGENKAGYINAGVYLLSADLLDTIAAGAASSLERNVFASLPPGQIFVFKGSFPFIDIGTPTDLVRANTILSHNLSITHRP
ncbi:MAG: nucleotidyltransferase family protein [Rhodospirillales bacterium]